MIDDGNNDDYVVDVNDDDENDVRTERPYLGFMRIKAFICSF